MYHPVFSTILRDVVIAAVYAGPSALDLLDAKGTRVYAALLPGLDYVDPLGLQSIARFRTCDGFCPSLCLGLCDLGWFGGLRPGRRETAAKGGSKFGNLERGARGAVFCARDGGICLSSAGGALRLHEVEGLEGSRLAASAESPTASPKPGRARAGGRAQVPLFWFGLLFFEDADDALVDFFVDPPEVVAVDVGELHHDGVEIGMVARDALIAGEEAGVLVGVEGGV